MPRKGKGNISGEGQELLEDKHIWGNETSFVEPYTNPENEKDPTKTVYSCHTRKDQSHPHSETLSTGSSGRDRDESCWENG
jgi:hypothetical protein